MVQAGAVLGEATGAGDVTCCRSAEQAAVADGGGTTDVGGRVDRQICTCKGEVAGQRSRAVQCGGSRTSRLSEAGSVDRAAGRDVRRCVNRQRSKGGRITHLAYEYDVARTRSQHQISRSPVAV